MAHRNIFIISSVESSLLQAQNQQTVFDAIFLSIPLTILKHDFALL